MKIRAARISLFLALILASIYLNIGNTSASAVDQNVQSPDVDQESDNVYIPFLASTTPQTQSERLTNGGFEQGLTFWHEYSLWGYPSIMPKEYLPIQPHSGDWAVWLGGAYNEINGIWQAVHVPSGNPVLSFYYWIASEDACGYDLALVSVNLEEVVDSFWLCTATNTNGWVLRQVDLSAYAGQNIELDIVVGTDDYLNSNLFIDDVTLTDSAVVPLEVNGESQGEDGVSSTMKLSSNGSSKSTINLSNRATSLSDLLQENR